MTHPGPYANSSRDMEHPQHTTGRVGFCLETQQNCLRNTSISHVCRPKTMSMVSLVHTVTYLYLERNRDEFRAPAVRRSSWRRSASLAPQRHIDRAAAPEAKSLGNEGLVIT